MKAVRFHQLGGPEVLVYEDAPDPSPGTGEVLLRVEAAGINFSDTLFRQGMYSFFQYRLPQIPGTEVAGTVAAVGPGVDPGNLGRRAMVILRSQGGYAQFVTTPVETLMDFPDNLSFAEAAAIPIQGISAYQMLRYSSKLTARESVLIHAAAGGVGSFFTQMARTIGAGLVIGTASTEEKLELVRQLGADHGINYVESDFASRVNELTDGKGVDVIIDGVGGDVFLKSLECLAPFGRLVILGSSSGSRPAFEPTVLVQTNRSVVGYFIRPYLPYERIMQESLAEISDWLSRRRVRPVIGAMAPLADASELHRRLVSRQTTGKLVLLPWA